jgi:hypothetical protein
VQHWIKDLKELYWTLKYTSKTLQNTQLTKLLTIINYPNNVIIDYYAHASRPDGILGEQLINGSRGIVACAGRVA